MQENRFFINRESLYASVDRRSNKTHRNEDRYSEQVHKNRGWIVRSPDIKRAKTLRKLIYLQTIYRIYGKFKFSVYLSF